MSSTSPSPLSGPTEPDVAPRHRVVIVGSGFGGLFAAQALRRTDVDVTLISRVGHHLFQPLLYQVATGILSEGEIAPSTREILKRQKNATVLLGTVTDIDLERRHVTSRVLHQVTVTAYDSLIVAAGAGQSYFGHDEFAAYAPGLKSIDDALELRGRIFSAFELAELSDDPAEREALMRFVVVGAGATGVEMAGQIQELAQRTLRGDFRRIDSRDARVLLLDGGPAVLGSFGDRLSGKALRAVRKLGIEVQLDTTVVGVDAGGLDVRDSDGSDHRIRAVTKVWAAGVQGSPLARQLGERSGARVDRSGRVGVRPDLTLPGHPEVFVVGDMMALDHLPGVAQVAIQGGRYAAQRIRERLAGEPQSGPFRYRDKGSMATISRFKAVASIGSLRFSGFLAWVLWLGVHLVYIIGFKSRVTTLLHWAVSFVGRGRSERTTTEQQMLARAAIGQLGGEPRPTEEGGPPAGPPES